MLRGQQVGLRPRYDADVALLHAEFHSDLATWLSARGQPWLPIAAESGRSPFAPSEPSRQIAEFSVVTLADDELVGGALLWGIDDHNRTAHLGLSVISGARRRGLSTDIVNVLCYYGFIVRGLRRLQLETLAGNAAMIAAATRCGFQLEGTLRSSAYVAGRVEDEVIYGILAAEWTEPPR